MKKIATFLKLYIRVSSLLLIGINLLRLFDNVNYLDFMQPPIPALFNSVILFVFSYFNTILKYFKLEISDLLYILGSISMIFSVQVGLIMNVYASLKGYDSIIHFANGGLLVLVGIFALSLLVEKETFNKLSPLLVVVFAFSFASTLGVLWEIFEYFADGLVKSNMQRYKTVDTGALLIGREALKDTMKDFILNTSGSLIVSWLLYFDIKRGSTYVSQMYIKRIEDVAAVVTA